MGNTTGRETIDKRSYGGGLGSGTTATSRGNGASKAEKIKITKNTRVIFNPEYAYNTSIGPVKQEKTHAWLKGNKVAEGLSSEIAKNIAIHALAILFPGPVAIALAAIAAINFIKVGLETVKLIDDYENGRATAAQARRVVGDVAELAIGGIANDLACKLVPDSPTLSGANVAIGATRDFLVDRAAEGAGHVAGNIAYKRMRARQRRGRERSGAAENGERAKHVQSRLAPSSGLELEEAQEDDDGSDDDYGGDAASSGDDAYYADEIASDAVEAEVVSNASA